MCVCMCVCVCVFASLCAQVCMSIETIVHLHLRFAGGGDDVVLPREPIGCHSAQPLERMCLKIETLIFFSPLAN